MTTTTSYATASTHAGAAILADNGHHSDGPGPYVMDAATLKGDAVVNVAGDDLGKVEAIMLDVAGGRIAYAVLNFGGIFGIGGKLFAVPFSALTLDAGEKRFVLDVSKEQLESAPGFDKDHWPKMADRSWAADVHTYYHAKPYWDDEIRSSRDMRNMEPGGAVPLL
jgi:sporulation protein YlmC with PRC-barrel domain